MPSAVKYGVVSLLCPLHLLYICLWPHQLFHFEVHLSIDVPGRSISLCVLISLPPRYPAAEHAPIVQHRGDSISGAALRSLHAALVQFMQLECEGALSAF